MIDNLRLSPVTCGLAMMTTPVMAATDAENTGYAIIVIGLFFYFIPGIVASVRKHRNRTAIGILNLLLGWTLIGWVAALVWALTADVEPAKTPTYTTRWSRAKAAKEQAAMLNSSQRDVFERDGAWFCVVDGKVYGSWARQDLALSGTLSPQRLRVDVPAPTNVSDMIKKMSSKPGQ
jgi:hypothetical protein